MLETFCLALNKQIVAVYLDKLFCAKLQETVIDLLCFFVLTDLSKVHMSYVLLHYVMLYVESLST